MDKSKAHAWSVADAKARFSEVIAQAQKEPQTITRNGRPSVVMVSVEEWQRRVTRKGSLAQFLLDSPLAGSEIEVERQADPGRDLTL